MASQAEAGGGPRRGVPPLDLPRALPVHLGVSTDYRFHNRPGLFLATRYLGRRSVAVLLTPLEDLPRLSVRMIRLALRLSPRFLDRADLTFPIIVAGRGWYQIALDGRHRISKAIWTGHRALPSVRVPWVLAIEILVPPVFAAEWLYLLARDELRRAGHRHRRPPAG